jgi:Zn-dependent protease with chaperone function/uncharacterized RDD family membrane protein YckC
MQDETELHALANSGNPTYDRSSLYFTLRAAIIVISSFALLFLSACLPIALCAGLAALFRSLGFAFPAYAMLAGTLLTLAALIGGIILFLFRRPRAELAIDLCLEREPELKRILEKLCSTLNSEIPDAVLLHSEPQLAVFEGKVRCLSGSRRGRILKIGVPIIGGLTWAQLTAILAHEFSHFTGRDTQYSARVVPAYKALAAVTTALQRFSTKEPIGRPRFVKWLTESLFMYLKLPAAIPVPVIKSVLQAVSKQERKHLWDREFRADRAAVKVSGPYVFRSALLRSAALVRDFSSFALEVQCNEPTPESSVNIYAAFRESLTKLGEAEPDARAEGEKSLDEETLSHPPISLRLRQIPESTSEQQGGSSAVITLHDQGKYEHALSTVYLAAHSQPCLAVMPNSSAGLGHQVDIPASVARRLLAGVIDGFMCCLSIMFLYGAAKPLGEWLFFDKYAPTYMAISACHGRTALIQFLMIPWLYFSVMESSWKTASVGKLMTGLSVREANGTRISFSRSTFRFFLALLQPVFGLLSVFTSNTREALWDIWPDCRVVVRRVAEKTYSWKMGRLWVLWLLMGISTCFVLEPGPRGRFSFLSKEDWEQNVGSTMDALDVVGYVKARLFKRLGEKELEDGKLELAAWELDQAASARPDIPAIRLSLAEAHYRLKRYDEAMSDLATVWSISQIGGWPPWYFSYPNISDFLLRFRLGSWLLNRTQSILTPQDLDVEENDRASALFHRLAPGFE